MVSGARIEYSGSAGKVKVSVSRGAATERSRTYCAARAGCTTRFQPLSSPCADRMPRRSASKAGDPQTSMPGSQRSSIRVMVSVGPPSSLYVTSVPNASSPVTTSPVPAWT